MKKNLIVIPAKARIRKFFIILFCLFICSNVSAAHFTKDATYQVCFTPGRYCTGYITRAIKQAKKTILVQAYSFTSRPIAKALVKAKDRGIKVKIILDKSQLQPDVYSRANYFLNKKIPIWVDDQPSIAHNKVMIIDSKTVITGSFNFTVSAQKYNAENLLIIQDVNLAKLYSANWYRRLKVSKRV
jgi:phosphatidylserine/phosphatidylglycerophosphate/cardiolipin synthase-like enzyme